MLRDCLRQSQLRKGAKLQMATQNAISSKEVKIWLNPKYSFKIEKNSSLYLSGAIWFPESQTISVILKCTLHYSLYYYGTLWFPESQTISVILKCTLYY